MLGRWEMTKASKWSAAMACCKRERRDGCFARPSFPNAFAAAISPSASRLHGKNTGSDEEEQLLGSSADRCVPEKLPDDGNTAYERHFVNRRLLIRDNDSANHERCAIIDEHARISRLSVEGRNTLNSRDRRVNLRVLDVNVQEDGALRRDLRSHLKLQHGVHELDGNRVVDDRLDRDLGSLLDRSLLVILRVYRWFRQEFADALRFGCGDDVVKGEVGSGEGVRYAARRYRCPQVCHQRHLHRRRGRSRRGRGSSTPDEERRSGQRRHEAADWACAHRIGAAKGVAAAGCRAGESELRAKLAREVAVRGDDTRLDFDLLGTLVK